jgi:acetate kinase
VVHGGHRSAPELIDDTVRAELDALTNLAPLHQPAALRAIDRTRAAWPGLPQVACFDTAFHTCGVPKVGARF